jgi:TPR repeat protein
MVTIYRKGQGVTSLAIRSAQDLPLSSWLPPFHSLPHPINVQCGANVRTPTDYREAAEWVRRAAEQAIPRAQLDLGHLYEQGKGVPLDYISAYAWYKTASAGAEKRAKTKLKNVTTHDITANQQSRYCHGATAKIPSGSRLRSATANRKFIRRF